MNIYPVSDPVFKLILHCQISGPNIVFFLKKKNYDAVHGKTISENQLPSESELIFTLVILILFLYVFLHISLLLRTDFEDKLVRTAFYNSLVLLFGPAVKNVVL